MTDYPEDIMKAAQKVVHDNRYAFEWDSDDNVTEAIAAALLAERKAKVKVKPLVWVQDGDGHWETSALTGSYHVVRYIGGAEMYRLHLSWSFLEADGDFDTFEAAKAAAQADYERRILSAIMGGSDE